MVLCECVYPYIAVVYPNPLQREVAGDILCPVVENCSNVVAVNQESRSDSWSDCRWQSLVHTCVKEFYDYIRKRKQIYHF